MTIPAIITPDYFLANCKRRFGTSNPERAHSPVWEWMVREGHRPHAARTLLGIEPDRLNFNEPKNPDWCFFRMGAAVIEHPDGRQISIAGEHEDWYRPDFCIYNDVIVRRGDEIEIYAYPTEVFPPTDFHTATLIGDTIWVIGALGYPGSRGGSETQVLTLDTKTYSIRRVAPSGNSPGWIRDHRATLLEDGFTIAIREGEVLRIAGDRELCRTNTDLFHFDTRTCTWTRMTDTSSHRQIRIRYKTAALDLTDPRVIAWYTNDRFQQLGYTLEQRARSSDEAETAHTDRVRTFLVKDVPIRICDKLSSFDVFIEGALSDEVIQPVLDRITSLLESAGHTVTGIEER